ncbi:MAG: DUF4440 domain-containing protein [Chitinophagaceae bacterium]|nr:MAG: DUF4440 domain-containing protein [Chitinophagaceae bacterium]
MTKPTVFSFLVLLATSSIISCDTAENPELVEIKKPVFSLDSARAGIQAANKTFMELLTKGDSAGIANLYTDDAKLLFPDAPPIVGKAAIQSVFGGIIRSGVTRVELITKEVFGTEELVGEEEEVNIYVGDKIVAEDKALVLWKKENGQWKLFRDMTNAQKKIHN